MKFTKIEYEGVLCEYCEPVGEESYESNTDRCTECGHTHKSNVLYQTLENGECFPSIDELY